MDEAEQRVSAPRKVDPYQPIAFSGETYTFHPSERETIDQLRKWSKKYFMDFQVYESETLLPSRMQAYDGTIFYKDFDIQAKLLRVDPIDEQFSKILL